MRPKNAILVASALLTSAIHLSADGLPAPDFSRIRPRDERASHTLAEGMRRSPTFRSLVARIERSDVLVYVDVRLVLSRRIGGATHFIATTPAFRLLKISLNAAEGPRALVALLGHELQHVLEVAEAPQVTSVEAFRALYREIGIDGALEHSFDSVAARQIGLRVREEAAHEPVAGPAQPARVALGLATPLPGAVATAPAARPEGPCPD